MLKNLVSFCFRQISFEEAKQRVDKKGVYFTSQIAFAFSLLKKIFYKNKLQNAKG